ncbi:MAG: iron-containing alcohol dehydrogenase, partial [Aristaeellaceae bacterium]
EETALAGVEALAAFIREIGLPTTLTELGIPEDTDLRAVAESSRISAGCCKQLTHEAIHRILLACK